jgi:hypothetical protein
MGCPKSLSKNWEVIKDDLVAVFAQLQTIELPLLKLNLGAITLLPKKEDIVGSKKINLFVF